MGVSAVIIEDKTGLKKNSLLAVMSNRPRTPLKISAPRYLQAKRPRRPRNS